MLIPLVNTPTRQPQLSTYNPHCSGNFHRANLWILLLLTHRCMWLHLRMDHIRQGLCIWASQFLAQLEGIFISSMNKSITSSNILLFGDTYFDFWKIMAFLQSSYWRTNPPFASEESDAKFKVMLLLVDIVVRVVRSSGLPVRAANCAPVSPSLTYRKS